MRLSKDQKYSFLTIGLGLYLLLTYSINASKALHWRILGVLIGLNLILRGLAIWSPFIDRLLKRFDENRTVNVIISSFMTCLLLFGGAALFIWRNHIHLWGDSTDAALNTFFGPCFFALGLFLVYVFLGKYFFKDKIRPVLTDISKSAKP
jgi:hypothetical protein